MRKKLLNIIELVLILFITIACSVLVLQSSFFQGKKIFGYRLYYNILDNANSILEIGDFFVVKDIEFDDVKIGNIITYFNMDSKNELIISKVIDIVKDNDKIILKTNDKLNTNLDSFEYKNQILGVYYRKLIGLSFVSKIVNNKIGFVISFLIPLIGLILLELIIYFKENKRREMIRVMENKLVELQSFEDKTNLNSVLETSINEQIKEINESKRDFKKINEFEETIKIPLEEIQKRIDELNEMSVDKQKKDKVSDDTLVLFTKDDIKDVIKKDMDIVNKEKLSNKRINNSNKNKSLKKDKVSDINENKDV